MEDYNTDSKTNQPDRWIQEQIQPLIFSDSLGGAISAMKIGILIRMSTLQKNTLMNRYTALYA